MTASLQPTITIKQVLDFLFDKSNSTPFSITAISFDAHRKTGGDIMKFDNCTIPRAEKMKNTEKPGMQPIKKGHHRKVNTINIQTPAYKHLVTIHVDLITQFNGKKVIW